MKPRSCRKRSKHPVKKSKRKMQVKMVPWFNKAEWEEVYKKLYSSNIEDQRWAVDRVTVWKSRAHPKLSLGIEATDALIRAKIQDVLLSKGQASCQTSDIALLYSMALVRFVNLVTELGQCQWNVTPVRYIARKFNIPDWLVDLRHNATHSYTPSIEMLRNGSNFALNWLDKNYWKKESASMSDWIPESGNHINYSEEQIAQCLTTFIQLQKQMHFSDIPRKDKKDIKSFLKGTLETISAMLNESPQQFIQVLVKPGFLIPSDVLSIEGMSNSDINLIEVPKSYEYLWIPVLSRIQNTNSMTNLLETLINSEAVLTEHEYCLAMAWARKIVEVAITGGYPAVTIRNSRRKKVLEQVRCSINWKHLLRAAILSPTRYTPPLLTMIASQIGAMFPPTKLQHLLALTAIYLGDTIEPSDRTQNDFLGIHDVEDLKKIVEDKSTSDPEVPCDDTAGWRLCEDPIDWSAYPLGMLPGMEVNNPHYLELFHTTEASDADLQGNNENVFSSTRNDEGDDGASVSKQSENKSSEHYTCDDMDFMI